MRIGMDQSPGMSLNQKPELSLLMKLSLRLEQVVGNFEKQILAKAEFVDIDLEQKSSEYHIEMLGSLLVRGLGDQSSLIANVVKAQNKTIADIEKVVVESFSLSDISFDIGQKRNVDVVTIVFSGNESFSMTVSLDKETFDDLKDSPSFKEAQILQQLDPDKVWAVQRYFGSVEVKRSRARKKRFLVCKEFLYGQMLGNITSNLQESERVYGKDYLEKLAYATGKTVANTLTELHGVPLDSNSLNFIIINTGEEGEIIVRYCDVEEVRTDPPGIAKEIDLIAQDFGPFAENFRRGIEENHQK